jgi:hypothetical protein
MTSISSNINIGMFGNSGETPYEKKPNDYKKSQLTSANLINMISKTELLNEINEFKNNSYIHGFNTKLEEFKINKIINFSKKGKLSYDNYALIEFLSKKIRSVYNTDLISNNSNKSAIIAGNNLKIQWIHNYKKNFDAVIYNNGNKKIIKLFKKNRADEFITELSHIEKSNKKNYFFSNIKLDNAIKTVMLIKKFFKDEI